MKNRAFFYNAYLFVLTALILSGVFSVSAQTVSDVDAVVQKLAESKQIPGAAVAVVRDGKIILAKGYGAENIETKTPADENTVYEIASVTKQFTAAAIMLLVEDDKIKLDDALGKYLTDVPESWQAVTIRQLLNQVSGIPNYTAAGKIRIEKKYAPEEILQMVADMPLEFAPGTRWQYSNTNYFLLGLVIEKVSKKSYAEFMKERIFKPLKMNSTQINTSGLKIEKKAVSYSINKDGWKKEINADPSQPFAAGAVVSTASDMAKWALALESEKLLKKNSLNEIWTAAKLSDGKTTDYGFGWQISKIGETDFVEHNGGIAGFTSHILRFPNENLSVAVMVNTGTPATRKLAYEIAGLYLPKFGAAVAGREKKASQTLADKDEATTKFLRETFEKMIAGTVDQNLFTPEMQKLLFPDRVAQLKSFLGTQGAIKSFDLVEDSSDESIKRRAYRVSFDRLKVRISFAVNAEGIITGVNLRPEQ